MEQLFVIKIGGNIVDDETILHQFLSDVAKLAGNKIIIHGGGKIATKIGEQLGIKSNYVDGRRITDAPTIDLVTMVYTGLINKKIVAFLQSKQCNAIGLCGADSNIVPAVNRPVKEIDYGFVGDVLSDEINSPFIKTLIESGATPIIAPITHDKNGQLLNTNADTIAQEIAKAMSSLYSVNLIYIFEKSGVLLDVDNEQSVINKLNFEYYQTLKTPHPDTGKAAIFEGMLPKLDNAFEAIKAGVTTVTIGKAEDLSELTQHKKGTTITYA